ncbi:MAG TPA: Calx-beta domain-containing protein, partial [Tepidisphaeraceae bacterium]|nr:Calx-beta domain-containing protein [Tepidisphaeraceae bacterium]
MSPNPIGRSARSTVETLERRLLLHAEFGAFINFQPPDAPVPEGYLPDYGDAFGLHANGFSYGWDQHNYEARNRRVPGMDTRYRTINYMQLTGNRSWEIAVPEAGTYAVKVVAGDGQYIGGRMQMRVEGMIALSDRITPQRPYIEATAVVSVTDGRLTITNGPKGLQNKLAFVEVTSFHGSVVNIKTTQPIASESGQVGTARVTRMGDLSQPLVVRYTVEGTAVAGQDYEALSGTVTIPAGRSFANINVVPIDNGQTTGDRSLTLRITGTDDYQLGELQAAGITIRDDGTNTGPAPTLPPVTRINFQPDGSATAPFYRVDTGAAYGVRSNGLTYGWSADNTADVRDRAAGTGDRRYDTFNHMQKSGNRFWEIAVPNGNYTVRVVAGDPSNFDSVYRIDVEGVLTVIGTPTNGNRFVEGTQTVVVSDGKLSISNGIGASNNKIAFVEITTGSTALPVVSVSTPVSTTQEGSATPGRVRFTRTGDTSAALLVSYAVAGNATPGVDYAPLSGTLTIPAGQTFADVLVSSIDDNAIESNETVSLKLNPSESYSSTLNQQGVVTIIDNDAPASNTINWSNTSGPATVYSETLSAVVNGKWYLFGGFPNSFQPVKISYVFDPNTNVYARIADMPEAITHAPAVVDGTKVYIMGGYVGKDTGGQTFGSNKIWIYDTVSNTW